MNLFFHPLTWTRHFYYCTVALFLTLTAVAHAGGDPAADYSAGEELYDLACANCHGKNLVNPGTASFNLKAFPKEEKQRFVKSVSEGKGFMPAMGELLDTEEIEQVWVYISRHGQQ